MRAQSRCSGTPSSAASCPIARPGRAQSPASTMMSNRLILDYSSISAANTRWKYASTPANSSQPCAEWCLAATDDQHEQQKLADSEQVNRSVEVGEIDHRGIMAAEFLPATCPGGGPLRNRRFSCWNPFGMLRTYWLISQSGVRNGVLALPEQRPCKRLHCSARSGVILRPAFHQQKAFTQRL